ncbi:hypothetical protein BX616_008756, partial [Lobosporangium transversale]
MASAIPIIAPPGVSVNDNNPNPTNNPNVNSSSASEASWTAKTPTASTPKPSASTTPSTKPASVTNSNKARTCRNIVIHGFCKYEGKGCEFNHDVGKPTSVASPEV